MIMGGKKQANIISAKSFVPLGENTSWYIVYIKKDVIVEKAIFNSFGPMRLWGRNLYIKDKNSVIPILFGY